MDVTMAEPGEILPDRVIDRSAYDKLQQSRTLVEDIVGEILSVKKEGRPKSQLRELVTQMCMSFVNLRQANRAILLEEDRVKAETEHAKAPVDFTTLQLHNLMYEKNHYVKAIKACKDFKSKYPDIELVPEEEFLREAPEDIKSNTMSNDGAHDLMLKRLNFELLQRKELCKLREKLEQRKKILLDTIGNRKKFLSSLPSHLKSLKKASLPVQNQLGFLHTKKLKQHQMAELLPPPLYIIYSQLLAQKEAFGENIDPEIVGSLKDAQTYARQQVNKETGTPTSHENSKLEDDVLEDEDDGQRRRKRPKKVAGKEALDHAGIYHCHPLKIILDINDDEESDLKPAKLVTLKFEYLLKLNVVCVGMEGSQDGPDNNILCNLFPDDIGLELPHQFSKLCMGDSILFDDKRNSRPYKWAQHLAGIDFLPEVSPFLTGCETSSNETTKHAAVISGLSLYRRQNRVQTVVQKIRSRKKAQLDLVGQLNTLSRLKWPTLTCESVPWARHTPLCSLCNWSAMWSLPAQGLSLPVNAMERGQGSPEIDTDGRLEASKEVENTREDGELPSSVPVAPLANDGTSAPSKNLDPEHSRRLDLLSKSAISPMNTGKSLIFKKHDGDLELILDSGSELDEPVPIEPETENSNLTEGIDRVKNYWVNFGVRQYSLVLIRKLNEEKNMKLEAKVVISKEYPVRPPLFTIGLSTVSTGENCSECSEWYNELRAMEAEVNVHVIKMLPWDQENFILIHQVLSLAMLFDFLIDERNPSLGRRSTSVVDVGLCKPVSGRIMTRSVRGRDHRRMISWKDNGCSIGYPC